MANNTYTYLEIKEFFDKALGDSLSFETTTNLTTDTKIISTELQAHDDGENGIFDNWWAEITEGNNAEVKRKAGSTTYATATGTLTCYGANFSADASAMTIRLHQYNPSKKEDAIIEAIKECYPTLHKKIDNQTLVTGNRAIDGHLESWSSATALTYWTATNITQARTATAGLIRGGTYSAKCTASAGNGYISIHSNTYPELLEFQGQTINAYVQAHPEVADDASIVIYTKQDDGTEETFTSTTATPAGEFTRIELENSSINNDLAEFEARLKVTTNGKYVYFDDFYIGGRKVSEYLLPDDFIEGRLSQVWRQNTAVSEPAFYDVHPFSHSRGENIAFNIIDDGTYNYLYLEDSPTTEYRLRLLGHKPLEIPTAYTSTITIDVEKVPLLIAKAREIFWSRMAVPVSIEDKSKYEYEAAKATIDYHRLLAIHGMKPYIQKVRKY